MTVVELWPGGGWYTDILAPVLSERGKLICTKSDALVKQKAQRTGTFGKVELVEIDPKSGRFSLGPDGSADMVLTFRNVHNWIMGGYEKEIFAASYRVLKPGGILGVVEHRGKPGTDLEAAKKTGYVDEALVIKLAESAGFRLDARSEVNANPKDTKDHLEGVWTLPPTLKLGELDKEKYLAIGESDRMTLRFVKPR
jgi:predicted methyltransferase